MSNQTQCSVFGPPCIICARVLPDVVWTKTNLFEYLENPRKFIPGTKTVKLFGSVKKEADRADLIAYLEKQK